MSVFNVVDVVETIAFNPVPWQQQHKCLREARDAAHDVEALVERFMRLPQLLDHAALPGVELRVL